MHLLLYLYSQTIRKEKGEKRKRNRGFSKGREREGMRFSIPRSHHPPLLRLLSPPTRGSRKKKGRNVNKIKGSPGGGGKEGYRPFNFPFSPTYNNPIK